MIYVTGDTHGDFGRFSKKKLRIKGTPEWDAGTIGLIKGPANASSDFLYI